MSTVRWWSEESEGYSLSGNETVATRDSSGHRLLFARRGIVGGTWYWETEYTNVSETDTSVSLRYGFAQLLTNRNSIPGSVDSFSWSNDINGTGRYHNSVLLNSSAVSFSARPRIIVRHWFNADTGQYLVSYSNDGLEITVHGWRDLAYDTADHNGSRWDTGKIWYPVYSCNTSNEIIQLRTSASNTLFTPPAGARYLSEAPIDVVPKGVSDEVFNQWLASDADRVMLVEGDYSTGEPDLLGLTGDGSTVEVDQITLINDIENQPGNEVYTAGYTNAVVNFGERKYWEVIPRNLPNLLSTWIGFKVQGSIDSTVISGSELNEVGINPGGDRWVNGQEEGCHCECTTSMLKVEPIALFAFEDEAPEPNWES
jgi:hypothetical protein